MSQVHPRAESCSLVKTQVILHNLALDSWASETVINSGDIPGTYLGHPWLSSGLDSALLLQGVQV